MGKISLGHASSTSTSEENFSFFAWLAFAFISVLSPKVSECGMQAAVALKKPYESGLKREFSSINYLPTVDLTYVLSNLAGNLLFRDPLVSQRTIWCTTHV